MSDKQIADENFKNFVDDVVIDLQEIAGRANNIRSVVSKSDIYRAATTIENQLDHVSRKLVTYNSSAARHIKNRKASAYKENPSCDSRESS
jgi:hypothetical protein